jgi:hypothetical protein
MKIIKSIFNWLRLLVGGKSELTDEAVDAGICDFSGQGRDRYGR